MKFNRKHVSWVFLLVLMAAALPSSAAHAAAPEIVDFAVPTGGITGIAQAPDGNIWYAGFATGGAPQLGEIGPEGPISEIEALGTPYGGLAVGWEGDVWFGGRRSLTRFNPASGFSKVSIPPGGYPETAIAPARGGGVWFAISRESPGPGAVVRATASGKVTEYVLPHREAGLQGMVETADGSVWFVESFGNAVGRLSPRGEITEYPLPGERRAEDVAADPGGGVIFTEGVAGIGRIDSTGHRTQVGPTHTFAEKVTVTADGTVWFTLELARHGRLGRLGPAGAFSEVQLPHLGASPVDVLAGAEGNVWFAARYPGNCGIRCNENAEVPAEGIVGRIAPTPVAEPTDGTATVRNGRADLTVDCAGASAGVCEGTLLLRRRGRALGSAAYALAAGHRSRLTVAVRPRLRRNLTRRGALPVEAVAVESDGTTSKRRLVLQRPLPRRRGG